jgi:CspA family cold shock protein
MSNRYNGTVKSFNSEKGFGFIQLEDKSSSIFVHHIEIKNDGYGLVSLNHGQKVTFEIGTNEQGVQALCVESV